MHDGLPIERWTEMLFDFGDAWLISALSHCGEAPVSGSLFGGGDL
jgi:hypothetical protein